MKKRWTHSKKKRLEDKSMKLNPKKVEYLAADVWFKFLGFSIKGGMVSLSSSRIKTFQHEIERRTIRCRDTTLAKSRGRREPLPVQGRVQLGDTGIAGL